MRMLLRPGGGSVDDQLSGRWILNAHPDEWYLQDVRAISMEINLIGLLFLLRGLELEEGWGV